MDRATTQLNALIEQKIGRRDYRAGEEFSVALFQLYSEPKDYDPQATLNALSPNISDVAYLNQLPAERFVELLVLMHGLEKRVSPSVLFTDFYEAVTEIGIHQVSTANWSFSSGVSSILSYFTLADGLYNRHVYLEKILHAFDTVLTSGTGDADIDQKTSDLLCDYSLATGITGVLISLLKACQYTKDSERIGNTVQIISCWVETQMNVIKDNIIDVNWELASMAFFPTSIEQADDLVQVSNELTWSDGDLGHVFLLYLAADFWQDSDYYRLAERIGMYTLLRKDFASTGISHSSFKRGSAGLVYTYDALWRHSRNSKYQQGAAFWYQQTIDLLASDMLDSYYEQSFFSLFDGVIGTALIEEAVRKGTGREDWMDMMLL